MAHIYKTFRLLIAQRMAADDEERDWLKTATFAKTANNYWLAWQGNDLGRTAFLSPDHPKDQPARWLESWDKDDTVDTLITYVESGAIERDSPDGLVLNIFIQDPVTGEWT